MKILGQSNKEAATKVVASEFSITIHLGDSNFIRVGSNVQVSQDASDIEIQQALATWRKLFEEQYREVLKVANEKAEKFAKK